MTEGESLFRQLTDAVRFYLVPHELDGGPHSDIW